MGTHVGLLQILAKDAVDQSNSWKVLDAGETNGLNLLQEFVHDSKWVGTAYSGQNGSIFHDRQNFTSHFYHNCIGIAIGHHTSQRSASSHPKPPRIVDYN